MKRIVTLTEQDLVKLVKRVINESDDKLDKLLDILSQYNLEPLTESYVATI